MHHILTHLLNTCISRSISWLRTCSTMLCGHQVSPPAFHMEPTVSAPKGIWAKGFPTPSTAQNKLENCHKWVIYGPASVTKTWPTMAPDNTKPKGNKLPSPAVLSPAQARQPFLPEPHAGSLFTQMASSKDSNTHNNEINKRLKQKILLKT